METSRCSLGLNWGHYALQEFNFAFKINNQDCFTIPYPDMTLVTASNKNELAIEIGNQDDDDEAVCCSELRFQVIPNDEHLTDID